MGKRTTEDKNWASISISRAFESRKKQAEQILRVAGFYVALT